MNCMAACSEWKDRHFVAYDSNRALGRGAVPKRTIGIVRHEMRIGD
jgi:hypothetical protein